MNMSTICNTIQERIVVGESLDEASQTHVMACASCNRLVTEWLELDSQVAEGLDGGVTVPDGFAERVMAHLAPSPAAVSRFENLLGRRWVQVALAQVGLAVAIANLLRFVFASLVPGASLGGVR